MVILLVEDDLSLAELVIEYLTDEGYDCDHAANGDHALELIYENPYEVLILDVNLPRRDGFEICKTVRTNGITTPIIMLTARGDLEDKLSGFEFGANDYLVKPFAMPELVARLNVLSGRNLQPSHIEIADLSISPEQHCARRGEHSLKLSREEWKLLLHLARKSPKVVSREELEDLIWPEGAPSGDALKMAIYRLRKTVDLRGMIPLIHTIRGIGIVLKISD